MFCMCVLQATLRVSTGVLYVCVAGYTQGFYRCFVCVCCRLHSGFLQVFCMCVLQATLRVSTGVLYVCVAGYTQGFYRCSVCRGCIARTTGSQSDPLGVMD